MAKFHRNINFRFECLRGVCVGGSVFSIKETAKLMYHFVFSGLINMNT